MSREDLQRSDRIRDARVGANLRRVWPRARSASHTYGRAPGPDAYSSAAHQGRRCRTLTLAHAELGADRARLAIDNPWSPSTAGESNGNFHARRSVRDGLLAIAVADLASISEGARRFLDHTRSDGLTPFLETIRAGTAAR